MTVINPIKMNTKLTNMEKDDVQQNGIDLRLDKVFRIEESTFVISENQKSHRGILEMRPNSMEFLELYPGHYQITTMNDIEIPKDESGFVITRSTLNRNAVFITSGWFDSGYEGSIVLTMHVHVGTMKIQRGTRIAQYISFQSDSHSLYNGSYGKNSNHDVRYKGR